MLVIPEGNRPCPMERKGGPSMARAPEAGMGAG